MREMRLEVNLDVHNDKLSVEAVRSRIDSILRSELAGGVQVQCVLIVSPKGDKNKSTGTEEKS